MASIPRLSLIRSLFYPVINHPRQRVGMESQHRISILRLDQASCMDKEESFQHGTVCLAADMMDWKKLG